MKKVIGLVIGLVVVVFLGVGDVESCHSIVVNTGIETPLCAESLDAAWSAMNNAENWTPQVAEPVTGRENACLQKADYEEAFDDEIIAGEMPEYAKYLIMQDDLCGAQGLTPEGR